MTGYDIITDIHNCYDEAVELIRKLGYRLTKTQTGYGCKHPEERTLVFGGDHVDRGPKPVETLKLLMELKKEGHIIVQGGHDEGLREYIDENPNQSSWNPLLKKSHRHSTIEGLRNVQPEFIKQVREFIQEMPVFWETEDLVVVHASYQPWLAWEDFKKAALHGSASGWSVEENWKFLYQGNKTIVTGHRNMKSPKIITRANNVVLAGIDTGVCYGNRLTAFRFPERDVVQVAAHAEYYPIPPHYWWP